MKALSLLALAVAIASVSSQAADAATSELDPTSRGAYRGDTGTFGSGGAGMPTGNYLAGQSGGIEFRNFFVYDLGAVSGLIVGAELQVDVGGFVSPDPGETYAIFDVGTDLAALTGNTGGFAAFDDLGSGASYGGIALAAADAGTVVTIPLTESALAALNASVGGDFALGGALTTLVGGADQYVFGSTLGANFVSKLVLTTIPTSVQALDPFSRGAYRGDTGVFGTGGSGTPTGNYLAGRFSNSELRNFFVYDLGSVSGLIVGAELQVDVGGFASPDAAELYWLFDVTSDLAALTGNTGGFAAFDDLGSGAFYGETRLTPADAGTVVSIPLGCAALAALNAAAGGDFALGGVLTPLGGSANEYVFGNTLGAGFVSKLVLTTIPTSVQAIDPSSRGAYRGDTGAFGTVDAGTPTGNYLTGLFSSNEYRNFFVYDLGSVGGLIVGAELQVDVGAFVSADPSETYRLFDVTTSLAALTGNTGGFAAFDDLGSGASYGEIDLSAADDNGVVTIPLDGSALAALNAAVGGDFALGGALTTLGGGANQYAFGFTLGAQFVSTLVLTVVPVELTDLLDPFSRGAYRDDTGAFGTGGSGTPTGNYLAGFNVAFEFRNFFAFDRSAVEGCVVLAQLKLDVATFSSAQVETYTLFDVTTDIAALTGNTGGFPAFDDLGGGVSYGEIDLATADDSTAVTISLDGSGVAALNAAFGGDVALGGAMTTPGGPAGSAFGSTLGASHVSQLALAALPLPEPPANLLRLAALAALALLAQTRAFLRRGRSRGAGARRPAHTTRGKSRTPTLDRYSIGV